MKNTKDIKGLNIKNIKFNYKSKTGKIVIFLLGILLVSLSAYFYKQSKGKIIEEPEIFIPLDSTKDEFLMEKDEIKIVEPKDEIIEIKDEIEGQFTLKPKEEAEMISDDSFDSLSGMNEEDMEELYDKMPKDKFEEAEIELESLIKEFRQDNGFTDKSDEEIWKKSKDVFDELDRETADM